MLFSPLSEPISYGPACKIFSSAVNVGKASAITEYHVDSQPLVVKWLIGPMFMFTYNFAPIRSTELGSAVAIYLMCCNQRFAGLISTRTCHLWVQNSKSSNLIPFSSQRTLVIISVAPPDLNFSEGGAL